MSCYFLVPDHDTPSWGVGMIYNLADMTRGFGLEVYIMRINDQISTPGWLDVSVKQTTLSGVRSSLKADDLLVVPDIMVTLDSIRELPVNKVVFVQGSVMIPLGLGSNRDYQSLGYHHVIVTMRHIEAVLEKFWPVSTSIISPFIADYFFSDVSRSLLERKRQILLFPKSGYKEAGYVDYEIVLKVLNQHLLKLNPSGLGNGKAWSVIEIKNRSHREVARLMQESIFFVNTNCFEAFNATVPEAMAAGCISFCYEAIGGSEFLLNDGNAFVFQNNHVFELLDKLLTVIDDFPDRVEKLEEIQKMGISTAREYVRSRTRDELLAFYRKMEII